MKSLFGCALQRLLILVTLFMAALMFTAEFGIAQEEEVDLFDRRHLMFGYNSNADVHAFNVNATLPISQIGGGLTAGLIRTVENGDAIADEFDATLEAGYEGEFLQAKGFVSAERSLIKGTDLSREVGAYVGTPEIKVGIATLEFGLGSLFESVVVQEALNLEDANAGRILGFTKVSIGKFGVFIETTPKLQLDDIELSIQPQYRLKVADNISIRFDGEFDWTSHPLIENVHWANRWGISGDIEF